MMNKILVIWWIGLSAILVIENLVVRTTAYFFIDSWSTAWFVAFASTIIWVWIWYWLAWLVKWKNNSYDNDDNLDF